MREETVVDLRFRDGMRAIPRYLATMMSGLPTIELTYDEAVELANRRSLGGIVFKAQKALLRDHFARQRHGSDLSRD